MLQKDDLVIESSISLSLSALIYLLFSWRIWLILSQPLFYWYFVSVAIDYFLCMCPHHQGMMLIYTSILDMGTVNMVFVS